MVCSFNLSDVVDMIEICGVFEGIVVRFVVECGVFIEVLIVV